MRIKTSAIINWSDPKLNIYLGLFEGAKPADIKEYALPSAFSDVVLDALKAKEISGKLSTSCVFVGQGMHKGQRVVVIGLGKKDQYSIEQIRKCAGDIGRNTIAAKRDECQIALPSLASLDSNWVGQAIAEGMNLGIYKYERYLSKSDSKGSVIKSIELIADKSQLTGLKKGAEKGLIIANSVAISRDLSNTPANDLTPKIFVDFVTGLVGKAKGFKVTVIDAKKAKQLKMDALVGVGKGSEHPPYLLIVEYTGGAKSQKPIALVGKGVTFDSGGISIKPSTGMGEMKGDMGGAAAVVGALNATLALKPKTNVLFITPLAENMPSGTAQRPGDVVRAMNGKTIEITNTDAEGRLILADALCYAVKQKPKEIIDLATLTGACVVALGNSASAILSNNDAMVEKMKAIAENTGDRVWQLPLYDDHLELLQSNVADLLNAYEGRLAGTSTAAKFLEQFVDETPWLHIDIASTMSSKSTKGYTVKGFTGAGTRNIIEYITDQKAD